MKQRPDISRLTRYRAIYFKVGLICSLSFVIMAFNYTVYDVPVDAYEEPIVELHIDIPVIRTAPEKPKVLPPPVTQPTENIEEAEDLEFIEEPLPEKTETPAPLQPVKEVIETPASPKEVKAPAPILEPVIEEKEEPFWVIVEEMPRFGDCDDESMDKNEKRICSDRSLLSYIYKHVRYPAIARENGVHGTVVLEFIIDEKGKIMDAKIIRNVGAGCGEEALRVIQGMPNWRPGKQRTKNVKVKMKLPIKFRLE